MQTERIGVRVWSTYHYVTTLHYTCSKTRLQTTGSNAVVIAYSETALENLIRIEVMSFVSYYTTVFLLKRLA